jgi:RimJ/RimL family protein N-acetyltransferase
VIARRATPDDLPEYRVMGAAFHRASPISGTISFDPEGFSEFYLKLLQNDDAGVWVLEHEGYVAGIAAAIAYPMYFNPSARVAQELWWWIDPSARGTGAGNKLYAALQDWAQEQDVAALFMIALEDENVDKMARVYGAKGLRPMERIYFKKVA